MLRISKLTDYAMLLMSSLARKPNSWLQASELAMQCQLSNATCAKILKILHNKGLLYSKRGSNGGYRLAIAPEDISIKTIIQAIEGPIAITTCSDIQDNCAISSFCQAKAPWNKINHLINSVLDNYYLHEFSNLGSIK